VSTPLPDPLKFVIAGNAVFTLRSEKTGTHFTYRVRRPQNFSPITPVWLVQVLTGPSNEDDYEYLGVIRPAANLTDLSYSYGVRSRIRADAPSAVAIGWALRRLLAKQPLPSCQILHEGRCGRCGRRLTVPESIQSGFGPECIDHV
jgi:hypothetical protein